MIVEFEDHSCANFNCDFWGRDFTSHCSRGENEPPIFSCSHAILLPIVRSPEISKGDPASHQQPHEADGPLAKPCPRFGQPGMVCVMANKKFRLWCGETPCLLSGQGFSMRRNVG